MISRVPFPNCRSSVIGLAIAGYPENDGHLSAWQEAVGHEISPDTHKNGSQEVGAALGAQAGEAKLREVITAGGFRNVRF